MAMEKKKYKKRKKKPIRENKMLMEEEYWIHINICIYQIYLYTVYIPFMYIGPGTPLAQWDTLLEKNSTTSKQNSS